MAKIVHRSNTIGIVANSLFVPGTAYTIVAYDVGGQVESASAGTSVAVRSGHGFAAGDKFIVKQASDGSVVESTFREVDSVSGDTLTISGSLSVSVGDILVNLGPDTGGVTPAYDGSSVVTYSDMEGTTVITESVVTANSAGWYSYWTKDRCWELIRDSAGDPVAVVVDAVMLAEDSTDYDANNYDTIQAAIDKCASDGGGTVHLDPAVTYTENITMKTEVTLDGHQATIKPLTDTAVVKFDGTTNCVRATVRNLVIDGTDDKATFTSQDGVLIEPAATFFHDDIRLERVFIQQCGRRGLSIIGVSNTQFAQHVTCQNVKAVDCAQQGIYVTGFVLESRFESCGLSRNYTDDTAEESVYFGENGTSVIPKRTLFSNCYFNNADQVSGPLFHANGFTQLTFDTCLFESTSNGADDFILADQANNQGLTLIGCTFGGTGAPTSLVNLTKCAGFKAVGCIMTANATNAFEFSATGSGQLSFIDIWDRSNYISGPTNFLAEGANAEAKAYRALEANSTEPSIAGWKYWKTNNSTDPTLIDNFTGGRLGDEIWVLINDTATDLDFTSSSLRGNAGANLTTLTTGDCLRCVYDGTYWYVTVIDGTA